MESVIQRSFIMMGIPVVILLFGQWMGGCKSTDIQSGGTDTGTFGDTESDSHSDVDTDTDSDTDADTDTDTDADTDSDADTDADSDTDSDVDTSSEYVDQDSDGWISTIDCDDENPDANQGLPEIYDPPNNVDDDCDGLTDEEPVDDPVGHIPSTCNEADKGASSVGCLFYAYDADQVDSTDDDPYLVFVSNVQREAQATVVLEKKVGDVWRTVPFGGPITLNPLTLHVFQPPQKHIEGSGFRAGGALRVTSDVPIVAYQLNPFGENPGTAEATLLLQVPAWDSLYYVMATPQIDIFHASAAIIASVDNTVVEITPSVDTVAALPHIPAGKAGEPFTVTLDAGDLAQFEVGVPGGSLIGTKVTSDENHPFAVFNSNECGVIAGTICDQIHEQLSGVQKWGREFVAARIPVRRTDGTVESSLWQMVASEDNTTIHFDFDPRVTGLPKGPVTLQKGEHFEAFVSGEVDQPGDFYVRSDKPIGLCNYMTSSDNVNDASPRDGDPSQVQISPVEQYLQRYVLLVPEAFMVDVLTIVRPTGVAVLLDEKPVVDKVFSPVGLSHEVGRVVVDDGVHTVEAAEGLFVVVVGMNEWSDRSYAYMGGTGTKSINQVQ